MAALHCGGGAAQVGTQAPSWKVAEPLVGLFFAVANGDYEGESWLFNVDRDVVQMYGPLGVSKFDGVQRVDGRIHFGSMPTDAGVFDGTFDTDSGELAGVFTQEEVRTLTRRTELRLAPVRTSATNSGLYSNTRYVPESGDVVGIEVLIFDWRNQRTVVVVDHEAYGAIPVRVEELEIGGGRIRFKVPRKSVDPLFYEGTITSDEITIRIGERPEDPRDPPEVLKRLGGIADVLRARLRD